MDGTIYILTRLFNFNDRKTSLQLCNNISKWIEKGEIGKINHCFLPYRDSNDKVKNMANKTLEIFKLDCKTIRDADILVGYCDGPMYDSGIGFEIGYAVTKLKPVILLTTDYFFVDLSNKRNSICSLANEVATIIHVRENPNFIGDYGKGLDDIEKRLLWQLKKVLSEIQFHKQEIIVTEKQGKHRKIYIDTSFSRTENAKNLRTKVIEYMKTKKITYYVANINDAKTNLKYIKNCDCVIILGDEFDFYIESSITQGLAYGWGKEVLIYSSTEERYYQNHDFILYKNPMIEFSATMLHSKKELLNAISKFSEEE